MSNTGANIDDIEVLRAMRIALVKFAEGASVALMGGESQVHRVRSWLENEQTSHWQAQVRQRTEAVARAADAVRQKKLFKDATGRVPSAFQEEKILAAARKSLEEAMQKVDAVRKAIPRFDKEADAYRSGTNALTNSLAADVPRAIATLDRHMITLQAYVDLTASRSDALGTVGPVASQYEQNISRGGEQRPGAQPPKPASEDKP